MDAGVSHRNRSAIREKDAAFIAPAILDSMLSFAMPLTLAVHARIFPASGNQACQG